jgi:transposase
VRTDLLRARHRLSHFLLRHGRRFLLGKRTWTKRHAEWLQAQRWDRPALAQTYRAYVRAVDEAVAQLQTIDLELRDFLTLEPFRARVERLRCFRGIDDLTALTIAAELGDPRRFPTAPSVMAFLGLIPSEYSSGVKRVQGAITKTDNAHLRRVLIESAWHYRHHPFLGDAVARRQRGAPQAVIDHPWVAQRRRHRRDRRLAARGKPKLIVTAVARELTGFLWAVLTR